MLIQLLRKLPEVANGQKFEEKLTKQRINESLYFWLCLLNVLIKYNLKDDK